MAIDINLKPQTKIVKFGDYGTFTIRPMGAAEELELAKLVRESQEISAQLEDMDEYVKAEESGDKEKMAEGMDKINAINTKIQEFKAAQISTLKNRITCKDEKAKERLFAEIPFETLSKAVNEAWSKEDV